MLGFLWWSCQRKSFRYRIYLRARLCVPLLLSEHLGSIGIPGEETAFTVTFCLLWIF